MTKIIDKNKARQGRDGTRVLIVLVSALLLALIVWAGVGWFGATIEPEEPVNSPPTVTTAPDAN